MRRLRRRVRLETKLHPQWKSEARAARKAGTRLTQRALCWAVPQAAMGLAASEGGAALALPIVLAWSATLMFARAAQIRLTWLARGAVSQPGWILALGTIAGLGELTPIFGGAWSSFAVATLGPRSTAICNVWPVGLREMRSCALKLNLIRFLNALPWWLVAGVGASIFFGDSAATGTALAGKFWLLTLLLQPFFLTFKYSSSTNDTSSGCLFVMALFALALVLAAVAITAGVLSFDADKPGWWAVAAGVLTFFSWLFEAAYRRAWRSQQFDLLAKNGSGAFR